jgi:hypothetical protein
MGLKFGLLGLDIDRRRHAKPDGSRNSPQRAVLLFRCVKIKTALVLVFFGIPGFQQQVSKEMEFGRGIWTSGQCRKEKKTTPTSKSLAKH